MNASQPQTIYLSDYQPPSFRVERLDLCFDLAPEATVVTATSQHIRIHPGECVLNGEGFAGQPLELVEIQLDGEVLAADAYEHSGEGLCLLDPPDEFELCITTRIAPLKNTALEGLYQSSGNYCTQCEAEGFRKITFYYDRPDVLTVFTTRIEADKAECPVLLANGNLLEAGELEGGRHYAVWQDPHPKPCYLFALVAGDLALIQDQFTTRSGRVVDLHIYVEAHNADKCDYAMLSLKNAMRWDEERFGLEYDLDIYMIVAVDDFNMGAMENKGLNVFNSKFVLAKPDTATDTDYQNIEGVIGHEYFHNWTGNRVTCRDWFQLSLKEGLTVFRDQEFSADMGARAIKRIEDVRMLRSHQFAEDGGPMSHPIRPDSYIEINNFYTLTVYEKGAEVIRMLHTLLGEASFQKGMALYFQRHDGQAVTCDDFVAAMADANGADLEQFKCWYAQAGTPVLKVRDEYDAERAEYTLHFSQHTPDTPGQTGKLPLHIPLKLGLLDEQGKDLPLDNDLLSIQQAEQSFTFGGIGERPVPSLLRGFSAPVKLEYAYSREQLYFLAANDNDSFNRWEAMQNIALAVMFDLLEEYAQQQPLSLDAAYADLVEETLWDRSQDKAWVAAALTLPAERYVAELVGEVNPDAIHHVREFMMLNLAQRHRKLWLEIYHENAAQDDYSPSAEDIAERSLKNLCLSYLMRIDHHDSFDLCLSQSQDANNMTDSLSALALLCHRPGAARDDVLQAFYARWQDDAQVMDKWFSVQASAPVADVLARVKELMQHPLFSLSNPNKVRALIGAFCQNNPTAFHRADGTGYQLVADVVLQLNALNPQVAARMVGVFNTWRRYDAKRQALMRAQLERIVQAPNLSRDVYEIVSKALA